MSSFYTEEELKEIGLKSYGKNVLISRNAKFYGTSNIVIGNNVRIDDFCIISGKIIINDYVHIAAGVYLFGGEFGIYFKNYSGISSRSAVYAVNDDYSGNFMTNPTVPEEYTNVTGGPVTFNEHVLVGSGCTVLPNVTLGEGCAVGSMSLVNKSLDEYTINFGIPAKPVKERKKNMVILSKTLLNKSLD